MKRQSIDAKKTILISLASLGKGGGLSRYALSLCKILKEHYRLIVLTTHDSNQNDFGEKELKSISPYIKFIKITCANRILKYLRVIKSIHSERPDFIINNYDGLIQLILPFIKRKAKFIHILHNDTEDSYRIGNINSKLVDAWIAPTTGIAEKFNTFTSNAHKEKIYVIPHGVEEGTGKRPKKNKRFEILFTGVLYEHKGVKELPLIINRLLDKNIDLHLTIIGSGILEDWLKEEFKNEIETGIVTFTGVIDHSLVYKHMTKTDVFLYPTHIDAFGLVIAEAMMNGAVPVVSLLKGVTDNLIQDGNNGYLIQQGDIEGFVNAVESLQSNRTLLKELSSKAREHAMNKFSLGSMSKSYIQFIQNI